MTNQSLVTYVIFSCISDVIKFWVPISERHDSLGKDFQDPRNWMAHDRKAALYIYWSLNCDWGQIPFHGPTSTFYHSTFNNIHFHEPTSCLLAKSGCNLSKSRHDVAIEPCNSAFARVEVWDFASLRVDRWNRRLNKDPSTEEDRNSSGNRRYFLYEFFIESDVNGKVPGTKL